MYLFELPGKDRGFLLPKKWILPVARFVVIYELFRFLVYWNSFIGQFVHPDGGEGIKGVEGGNRYFSPLQVFLY